MAARPLTRVAALIAVVVLARCTCEPEPSDPPACSPGAEGCGCSPGECDDGLVCQDATCVSEDAAPIPVNPRCYSPCRESYVDADGEFRYCSPRGLMAGCLGDNVCDLGTCTPPGGFITAATVNGTCNDDGDCPSYQTCLEGRCMSNCAEQSDCNHPFECFDYVCRKPCHSNNMGEANECPEGSTCSTEQDATRGHCLPLSAPPPIAEAPSAPIGGSFAIEPSVLSLSNVRDTASFTITNDDVVTRSYTVSKPRSPPPEEAPELPWLTIGCTDGCTGQNNGPAQVESFEVEVGAGDVVTITIAGAGDGPETAWTGQLEVTGTAGPRKVFLDYVSEPGGQWAGSYLYYATFNGLDSRLSAWAANDKSAALAGQTENALVQKWQQMMNGDIAYDEMLAVLETTQNGNWRSQYMKELCPGDAQACYPYDNTQGYSEYTANSSANRIPAPGLELPFVMNLRQDAADPTLMTGRVHSAGTLQSLGNPQLTVRFATDPLSCGTLRGRTICELDSFDATTLVGARARPRAGACGDGGETDPGDGVFADTLALKAVPWLVPGFDDGVTGGAGTPKERAECRDLWAPLGLSTGVTGDEQTQNTYLAEANPIPDGLLRKRELSLLSGIMVDQNEMLLLVRESFEGFSPADTIESYGVIRLFKVASRLSDADFVGSEPSQTRQGNAVSLAPTCSEALLDDVEARSGHALHATWDSLPADASLLAGMLLDGVDNSAITPTPVSTDVHFLCHMTGLFDLGPDPVNNPRPCPHGSKVTFFTLTDVSAPSTLENESCQSTFVGSVSVAALDRYKKTSPVVGCDAKKPQPAGELCFLNEKYVKCTQAEIDAGAACEAFFEDGHFDSISYSVSAPGSCAATLKSWLAAKDPNTQQPAPTHGVQSDLVWRCEQDAESQAPSAYCEFPVDAGGAPIMDLTLGKAFYAKGVPSQPYNRIRDDVAAAFRYKTQFRSRSGQSVGFAPEICVPGSSLNPYCYDPATIEDLRAKTACLAALYIGDGDPASLLTDSDQREDVRTFLEMSFAAEEVNVRYDPVTQQAIPLAFPQVHHGFERLNAELLIMLGDEAVTRAFASRFDLAGSFSVAFAGSKFELDGIDLSGGAGYELYSLYQGVQYYQLALDRFFELAPTVAASLELQSGQGFIGQRSATDYFSRLIRASTQKARAYSEISRRYLSFNQPALSRAVVERAYGTTYMEAILLPRLVKRIIEKNAVSTQAVPQLEREIELASLSYRSALREMREAYASITDEPSFFGYAVDFVPFPVLGADKADDDDSNGFEKLFETLLDRAEQAADKELIALESTREFDTSAAEFQAELVSIRENYEDQLAELCGTFEDPQGRTLPATRKYAHLTEVGRATGDACGLLGSGAIVEAVLEIQLARLELEAMLQQAENIQANIEIERDRVSVECDFINQTAAYTYKNDTATNLLEKSIGEFSASKEAVAQAMANTVGTSGIAPGPGLGVAIAATAAGTVTTSILDGYIKAKEVELRKLEQEESKWLIEGDCAMAQNESNAVTRSLIIDLTAQGIEVEKALQGLQLALSRLESLRAQAKRLQDQQLEAEELAINIEASRNDPNVRIFKNDAVLTADRTFQRALRAAWAATKVYEYYTSTTYARKGDLFLVRLVTAGDISLERYAAELEDSFYEFQEEHGTQDLRLHVLSAKDEIFKVPFLEATLPCSRDERTAMFRDLLRDERLRNDAGYLTIPFSTTLELVSPVTRNHKIAAIEAELVGAEGRLGDGLARVYVRQSGTGVVLALDGDKQFFTFGPRSAVLNAFLNGERTDADDDLYENTRLRDRPFLNTRWELMLNQVDEAVNQDIDLDALEDIRLYIYYSDFTSL